MITISFQYKGNEYSALVNEKAVGNNKHYRITVMNGELEALLHGNNVFATDDMLPEKSGSNDKENLLLQIKNSLVKYLDTNFARQ